MRAVVIRRQLAARCFRSNRCVLTNDHSLTAPERAPHSRRTTLPLACQSSPELDSRFEVVAMVTINAVFRDALVKVECSGDETIAWLKAEVARMYVRHTHQFLSGASPVCMRACAPFACIIECQLHAR